jgi:hypothetical protein
MVRIYAARHAYTIILTTYVQHCPIKLSNPLKYGQLTVSLSGQYLCLETCTTNITHIRTNYALFEHYLSTLPCKAK